MDRLADAAATIEDQADGQRPLDNPEDLVLDLRQLICALPLEVAATDLLLSRRPKADNRRAAYVPRMRIAFWNLNWRTNRVALAEKQALIDDVRADVLLLAECCPETYEALAEPFGPTGSLLRSRRHAGPPQGRWAAPSSSVAAASWNGGPSAGCPDPSVASLPPSRSTDKVSVCSRGMHPHAVAGGPDRMVDKMAAYRTVIDLINDHQGPLVVGCDMNTPWFDPWERPDPLRPVDDPFHDDDRIYGTHQAHALRDAWRLHLESHPDELTRAPSPRSPGCLPRPGQPGFDAPAPLRPHPRLRESRRDSGRLPL